MLWSALDIGILVTSVDIRNEKHAVFQFYWLVTDISRATSSVLGSGSIELVGD